jgi:hypothetical protein
MLRQLFGIGERERNPEMPGRPLSGILPRCADSADLEVWKRLQGWDVSD